MTVITNLTVTLTSAPLLWSSPDLLRRLKQHARRPGTDQAVSDDLWYDYLTEAQVEVYADLFTRYPDAAWSAPVLLVTDDGGYTYTFGQDIDGDPIYPMGFATVYPNLRSIPDSPLVYGEDYELEGYVLRIPGNRSRTFQGGPYARFVTRPDVAISDIDNPLLFPKEARMLLVWKALQAWASRPGSGADPSYYAQRYTETLIGEWTKLATQYNRHAATGGKWWSNADFAVGGGL